MDGNSGSVLNIRARLRGAEIEIFGHLRKATLFTEPLFDPKAERMRG
jgi:hypothetical protein